MINNKIKRIITVFWAVLMSILIINSYSVLLGYYSAIKWIIVLTIIFCCVFGPESWGVRFSKQLIKDNILWIICSLYLLVSCIYSYDKTSSFNYSIGFISYSLLLIVGKMKSLYIRLFDILETLLLFCAFSIYLNVLFPRLMIGPLRFLMSPAALSTIENFVSKNIFTGIIGDNANAAFAMNIGFAISISKYIIKRTKKFLIQTLMFFGTLLFIGKRMLMLIPFILLCVAALIIVKNNKLKKYIVGVLVVLLLVFGGAVMLPGIGELFFRNSDDLFNSRTTVLWPIAFKMFDSNKLFGTGINTFNYMINNYNYDNATLSEWGYHAHNIYIQLLGETGLFGVTLFGTLWGTNIVRTVYLIKHGRFDKLILSISLLLQVIWLVYGITGNTMYYTAQLLLYVVAVGSMESVKNGKK